MESDVLLLRAEYTPRPDLPRPGTRDTWRNPSVAAERRPLGALRPGWIRLRMELAGVCGTDLHVVQSDPETGYVLGSSPLQVPAEGRVLGHEGVGTVIEVGAGVSEIANGGTVALESLVVCHRCDRCRRGQFNQCRLTRLLGLELDGLFATYADVPASIAHDVTELIDRSDAAPSLACLEPAAVAFVGCQNARVSPGDHVVVFGAGPIGVFSAMLARVAFGAASVEVVEPLSLRRNLARSHADRVHTPEEFFGREGPPVDVAIEASGALSNIDAVLPLMNANGRVVLLGRSGTPLLVRDVDHMITNAVSITGSRGHLGGAFRSLLDLYRSGVFSLCGVVTEVVEGLDALAERMRAAHTIPETACKLLVRL